MATASEVELPQRYSGGEYYLGKITAAFRKSDNPILRSNMTTAMRIMSALKAFDQSVIYMTRNFEFDELEV